MDLYDNGKPFVRPQPLHQAAPVENAEAGTPAPPASPVFPWRQEQPALYRLTSPTIPADLLIGEGNRVARYAVVEVVRDIEAKPDHSVTAQANIDSRNALAVLLPNIF